MTSSKQAGNAIDKAMDGAKKAVNGVKDGMSRQQKKQALKEREKLNKDMIKQGLSQEQIDHYWFVHDNADRAKEVFASMQKMLNNLGYYVQPQMQYRKDGAFPIVDLGYIPFEQFQKIKEDQKDSEKKKIESFKNGAGFQVSPIK